MSKEFVSDLKLPNQEYAVLIRSFKADEKIINIQKPELPEGVSFFCAKDLPGKNSIGFLNENICIFADEKTEYTGQPVGILTGPDKRALLYLRSLFKIKTEENPKPAKPSKKRFPKTAQEKDYFSDQVAAMQMLSSGNAEEVFEKSKHIVNSSLYFEPRYHFHAEPVCVKTEWIKDRLTIHVSSQWPFNILDSAASALNMPKSKINVILHKEAESLDGRMWFPCMLAVQAAVASFLTKKNISIEFSRKETFLYTTKTPAITIRHKSAVSDSGLIEAMNISIMMDAGAYNPFVNEMLRQMTLTAAGIYRLSVFTVNAVAVRSTNGLTDLFSGWGDAYTTAALEKHLNEIAERLNVSPVQLRMDNILRVKQERIYGEKKEENFKFDDLFQTVCTESDFFRKHYAYRALNTARKSRYDGNWRGIGIASGFQYNGSNILVKAGMNYSAEITLTKENKAIVKAEPSSDNLKNILKRKIAQELETEENRIVFLGGSTDDMSLTGAATASCGISILPDLIEKCCQGIKKLKFRKPLPLTVTKTYKVLKAKDWSNEILKGSPFISYTPGVCAVELELEPSTYKIKTRGIWFACSLGQIYSEEIIKRTLHKSISNALSSISVERMRDGVNPSFQFKIISASEIPPIKVYLLKTDIQAAALSEIAEALVPAAYISALNQILVNYNLINSLPVFAEDIFQASLKKEVEDES